MNNIKELSESSNYSQLLQFRKQWINVMDMNPKWSLGNMKSYMYRTLKGKPLDMWKNAEHSQFNKEEIFTFLASTIGQQFKEPYNLKQDFINYKQGSLPVNEYASGLYMRWEAQLDSNDDPNDPRCRTERANAFRTGLNTAIGFQLKLNREFSKEISWTSLCTEAMRIEHLLKEAADPKNGFGRTLTINKVTTGGKANAKPNSKVNAVTD